MNYLRLGLISMLLFTLSAFAGADVHRLKKDDKLFKKLKISIEFKESSTDSDKISVTLKMVSDSVYQIYLLGKNASSSFQPSLAGKSLEPAPKEKMLVYKFDIKKDQLENCLLRWPEDRDDEDAACRSYIELRFKDFISKK